MRRIYLDYNATTPIAPSVQEGMLPFLAEHYGNPSSDHALGRAADEALTDARGRVASLIGGDEDEIVFTSGGTEADNLALIGVLSRYAPDDAHLVISAFEHPAVAETAAYLEGRGYGVTRVPVTADGLVDPERVERAIRPQTRLVSIMHANNEIGTIQPIPRIAEICARRGVLLHSDAAQSAGKVTTRVDLLGVDLLTLAGHKLYAPKGVGALWVRRGTPIEPILHGGGHEAGLRAGTENIPAIVGFGIAASLAARSVEAAAERMGMLRDRLEARLAEGIGDELSFNGATVPRLPNTSSVNFPETIGAALLARIPELCASTGSACHASTSLLTPTQSAIGLPSDVARGTVRLSLGWYTDEAEIDRAAELLLDAWEGLR